MHAYYPLLLTGGIIGFISILLIVAYASIKDKKQAIGFDRHMKDGEIVPTGASSSSWAVSCSSASPTTSCPPPSSAR